MSSTPVTKGGPFTLDLLQRAWQKVKLRAPAPGVDEMDLTRFSRGLRGRLIALCNALNTCRYVPEPSRGVPIPKADGQTRLLMLPSIRDRIAQACAVELLLPYWEQQFLDCSYAYRPGKGHHKALGRVEHSLRSGKVWVARADIDNFFDSIRHDILQAQLKQAGTHPALLHVVELWLRMGYVGPHGLELQQYGIPQGALISPLLANIYLHPFDIALRLRGYEHVRYADDYVILCNSQAEAEAAHRYAAQFLRSELKLELNPEQRPCVQLRDGFVFLGIEFRGSLRRIAAEKLEKARERLMEMAQKMAHRPAEEFIQSLNATVRAWQYYYQRCNDRQCFEELDQALQDAATMWARAQKAPLSREEKAAFLRLERLAQSSPRLRLEANRQLLADIGAVLPTKGSTSARHRPLPVHPSAAAEGRRRHYDRVVADSSTLLVAERGSAVGIDGQFVRVRCDGSVVRKCHLKKLRHILLMAERISLSTDLLMRCAELGIALETLDFSGRTVARLTSPLYGEPHVWEAQLLARQSAKGKVLAIAFVRGKIENQLRLLKYLDKYWRRADRPLHRLFLQEQQKIAQVLRALPPAEKLPMAQADLTQHLMGYEGQAAASYWKVLVCAVPAPLGFHGRMHQHADDPVNHMLNYGYGVLYGRVHAALTAAGLNPHWGFLHSSTGRHPALVYDLVELFRPHAVDRVVLSLVKRGRPVSLSGDRLSDATRRLVLAQVLRAFASPTRYRGKRYRLEEVMLAQAQELAAYLVGEKPFFRPFAAPW